MEPHETAKKIQDFFGAALDPQKEVEEIREEIEQLTPELLAKYKELSEQIDALEKIKAHYRAQLLKLGSWDGQKKAVIPCGPFALTLTRRTSATVDYDRYIEAELGEEAVQELAELKKNARDGVLTSPYIKIKDQTVVEVYRLGELPEF